MKRNIMLLLLLIILSSCKGLNTEEVIEPERGNPPQLLLEHQGGAYEAELGAYCWDLAENAKKCVDAVVPSEVAKPLVVKASEQVTMEIGKGLKPDSQSLNQKTEDGWIEVSLKGNQLTVPSTKGLYVYNYEVKWDGEARDVKGNIVYGFILEVN